LDGKKFERAAYAAAGAGPGDARWFPALIYGSVVVVLFCNNGIPSFLDAVCVENAT
jgi:hypothetical protein